jgi:hypothetical protein
LLRVVLDVASFEPSNSNKSSNKSPQQCSYSKEYKSQGRHLMAAVTRASHKVVRIGGDSRRVGVSIGLGS